MSAPERISVLIRNGAVHLPNGSGWKPHDFTEYLLNTPEALAAAQEVQRLIAEAVAREREAADKALADMDSLLAINDVSPVFRDGFAAGLTAARTFLANACNRKETT